MAAALFHYFLVNFLYGYFDLSFLMDPQDLEISILMVNINSRFFGQLNAYDLIDALKISSQPRYNLVGFC
jgi:hypothetical protein